MIICPSVDCKHNDDCHCTAENIRLSEHSVMTLHEGRQLFWKCKNYEMSEEAKRILELLEKHLFKERL